MNNFESKDTLGTYEAGGLMFNLGSDFHIRPTAAEADRFLGEIGGRINADVLFILGDIFTSPHGKTIDTSTLVNKVLKNLALKFKQVLFVPGNHDLQRPFPTEDPWCDFELPNNVTMPYGSEPVLVSIGETRVLLANIGFDFDFIDPSLIGVGEQELLEFYKRYRCKYLMRGVDSIPDFKVLTSNARKYLTPEIDIFATHVLPHPSLATFKVTQVTEEMEKLMRDTGIPFIVDIEGDKYEANLRGTSIDEARQNWNLRSLLMGSDVLGGSDFRDGLTCLYGHNHRGTAESRIIDGKKVNFLTHQRWFNKE